MYVIHKTSDVPPTCVVCHQSIEKVPDENGIIAWPVDSQGPKHWDCWKLKRDYRSVECPTCKGAGRIYDK